MIKDTFNQRRWEFLSNELKIVILIKLLAEPYFSNLVIESGLENRDVHTAIDQLIDLGTIDAKWKKVNGSDKWVRMFYTTYNTRSFIDSLIQGLKDTC